MHLFRFGRSNLEPKIGFCVDLRGIYTCLVQLDQVANAIYLRMGHLFLFLLLLQEKKEEEAVAVEEAERQSEDQLVVEVEVAAVDSCKH